MAKQEPGHDWRAVMVSDQRTWLNFAHRVKGLFDVNDPGTGRIMLVIDQLKTHSLASLYAAFAPAEAERRTDRLEIHHTPTHGS